MKQKTLQERYILLKEGKTVSSDFLREAKRQFPNLLANTTSLKDAEIILKNKGIINEGYIDLKPIGQYESKPLESWEKSFKNFLKEEREDIKADNDKFSKYVEETQSHNWDFKDKKNINNVSFQQFLSGMYSEYQIEKNCEKTLEEVQKIVEKNLASDPLYYVKKHSFGVEGVGYEEMWEVIEAKGKHKASGYGDLDKDTKALIKEEYSFNKGLMNMINEWSEDSGGQDMHWGIYSDKTDPFEENEYNKGYEDAEAGKELEKDSTHWYKKGFYDGYSDTNGENYEEDYEDYEDDRGLNDYDDINEAEEQETGLLVTVSPENIESFITWLDQSNFYAEEESEGVFFFPEDPDKIDNLEKFLQIEMAAEDISVQFEGQEGNLSEGLFDRKKEYKDGEVQPRKRGWGERLFVGKDSLLHKIENPSQQFLKKLIDYSLRCGYAFWDGKEGTKNPFSGPIWEHFGQIYCITSKENMNPEGLATWIYDKNDILFERKSVPSKTDNWIKQNAKVFNESEDNLDEGLFDKKTEYKVDALYDDIEERFIPHIKLHENKNINIQKRLKEIEQIGAMAAMEAKINAIQEEINNRQEKISTVSENEALADFVNTGQIKAIEKEIKMLEKEKAKFEKIFAKAGKKPSKPVINDTKDDVEADGMEPVNEESEFATDDERYYEELDDDAYRRAYDEMDYDDEDDEWADENEFKGGDHDFKNFPTDEYTSGDKIDFLSQVNYPEEKDVKKFANLDRLSEQAISNLFESYFPGKAKKIIKG